MIGFAYACNRKQTYSIIQRELVMAQMQTLSIRLPDDDFHWLLNQQIPGTKTPSEKLRALLQKARQQEAGLNDPARCAAWMRELVQPFIDTQAGLEHQLNRHSDLLSAIANLAPQLMATLITAVPSENRDLALATEIESRLAQQAFRLFTTLLRGAVTSNPSTYAADVYDQHLPDIIELAQIIHSRKEKEANHG